MVTTIAATAKLYRAAADQDYDDAKVRLGMLYERGRGVPQDDKEAYFWFTLASKHGDKAAEHERAEVIKKLRADDVQQLEVRA